MGLRVLKVLVMHDKNAQLHVLGNKTLLNLPAAEPPT